ncbi:hypothetical protein CUJ84_Chr004324 [Rhizobium leguminosarum]|uniref:3-hydroxyacyl-CoA dehydrogenase NAD binding domain-containing protein n=1 Tax=Rhizobium leguminosarum TaxID=384 RepID=A0A2K9Z8R1_RHILE|nr:hypothetical protein CUJ84_Chr004324 [Rhizobium leguminosarum]
MPCGGLEMNAVLKNIGIIGAGQMGCGIAHVSAAAGYRVHIYDLSQDRIESGLATINGNLARLVTNGKMTEEERKSTLSLITGSSDVNDLAPPISLSRQPPRMKRSSARSIRRSVRSSSRKHCCHQHLFPVHHPACCRHRPPRALHGHTFHEPGAGDEAGRAGARHRDRREDLFRRQGIRRNAGKDHHRRRGFPGLHRQPHSAADDQRSDLHAL